MTNGKKEYYNVPLRIMRGEKAEMAPNGKPYVYLEDWPWTFPEYTATLPLKFKNIASVRIDPSSRMLDVDLKDNQFDHAKSNKNKVDRP